MGGGGIGVFDSGVGGLTVVRQIKKMWPKAKIVYLGDTARVPYGNRSVETIEKFAVEGVEFLQRQNVAQIVIACNTMSAVAMPAIKKVASVKIWDVVSPTEDKLKSVKGRIVLLGTRATVNSRAYPMIQTRIACPLLVPLIEEGEVRGEIMEKVLNKYLGGRKMDVAVLGCTHYPIIEKEIEKYGVEIINPAVELAQRLDGDMEEGEDEYFVTDLNKRFIEMANMFLGQEIGDKIKLIHL